VKKAQAAACTLLLALAAGVLCALAALVSTTTAAAAGPSLTEVPDAFQPWIQRASRQCRHPALTPALLAAQLYQESKFYPAARSAAGAEGPAQFMPETWDVWGRDADGNGSTSPHDIGDAVTAQGRFVCSLLGQAASSGYPGDPRALALAGYNAGWGNVEAAGGIPHFPETQNYVTTILANVPRFQGKTTSPEVTASGTGPDALRKAVTQLGLPYSYGGGSPAGPSTGFCADGNGYRNGRCVATSTVGWDCSSLVQYAYWPARHLPRTAAEQYTATADRPVAHADLRQGDLLFWSHGGTGGIYHVAIYAGSGRIAEAPKTGDVVKVAATTTMPATDFYGATRP
jgi:cell wall-associated NlpC family hydrolase